MATSVKPTAVDKLSPSRLDTARQMQGLGGDVDIDDFHMQMRNHGAGIDIVSAITDAVLERTVTGASTLTVSVDDTPDRKIQRGGVMGHGVDVNIDGLWYTLTAIKKTGRGVSLVFEEREVNVLRRYDKPIFASRDQVTRAQFVLRMIQEVKEIHLKWIIPELNIKQDKSDLGPGQILVNGLGQPQGSAIQQRDAQTSQAERGQGIPTGAKLQAKGVPATREQINNADTILSVGQSLHAPHKVMVASIMTAIDESDIINLTGGDRDSVGVFQQRKSQGWPATRNVATDAAAFFRAAITINADPAHAQDSLGALCQAVQHSGTPDGSNYARYQDEATAFVDAFDRNPTSAELQLYTQANNVSSATNMFMRGQVSTAKGMQGAFVLTKENSWNCMQRLATEVNWRAFVVSGVVYFISDRWLFKSKPFMTISEDSPGIDWIDYDYDEGKHKATCTVACHLSRWSAPPGSVVQVIDMGVIDDKYLVTDVQRSLYQAEGVITLEKPLPLLPEPISLSGIPKGFGQQAVPTKGGSGGTAKGGFSNPFPKGWIPNRLDQGYDGTFKDYIAAPFDGTITYAGYIGGPHPWGGYIQIRADTQPAGLPTSTLYFAEGLTPTVNVGQRVLSGARIANPAPSPYGGSVATIEWGVANDGPLNRYTGPYAGQLGLGSGAARSMVISFYKWARDVLGVPGTTTDASAAGNV